MVRFGRLIGLSRGRAVGVATLSIQKLGGGGGLINVKLRPVKDLTKYYVPVPTLQ